MVDLSLSPRNVDSRASVTGKAIHSRHTAPTGLTETTRAHIFKTVEQLPIVLDGYQLDASDVVNAAKWSTPVEISDDPAVAQRIERSVNFLIGRLNHSIYGVTTGFGGSADTRTTQYGDLQTALLEHQLAGVLPSKIVPGGDNMMPEAIVRGAMVIRVNSLVRGHSAVRQNVLESIVYFLNHSITPCVPLRGSISASGDLSPLSYVASAICGHPDVKVIDRSSGLPEVLTAADALAVHGIKPIELGPKEALGLINGTAFSASAASLAMDDANFYASLAQVVTGMTVEAMNGMKGTFHPFIHDVTRPHPGQIEVAANIRGMLAASTLAISEEQEVDVESDAGVLRQDRYPLRTSPQWLGPQLESLALANQQVGIELNSTTDNPLMDVDNDLIHHGGAFQAFSITQAMEATRLTLEHIGKLAFAQLTELVNCTMNRGLPSCLAGGGQPSTNFFAKGLDIHAAAYCAELGFLASPMSTHIQSAEMANQAVNSMALASARKTIEANDVLGMLLSSHLLVVCQAIDLRVIDMTFRHGLGRAIVTITDTHFADHLPRDVKAQLIESARNAIFRRLDVTTAMDAAQRYQEVIGAAMNSVVDAVSTGNPDADPLAYAAMPTWRADLVAEAGRLAAAAHADVANGRIQSSAMVGRSAGAYRLVRETLGIPLRLGDVSRGTWGPTIGSSVTRIFEALRVPSHRQTIVECLGGEE